MARQLAVALDVGGTKVAAGLVDTDGRILTSLKLQTPGTTSGAVVDTVNRLVKKMLEAAASTGEVVGIGLAVAGTINFSHGIIVQSPNLPVSHLGLKAIIEEEFGLPTFLDNDGNLAAFGEKHYGSAKGARNLVGLTVGTGIGAGIIADGRLYRGATGSAAEIGHMVIQATGPQCTCGSYGCYEEMAAGRALVRLAREKAAQESGSLVLELAGGSAESIEGPMVTEAAQRGDRLAMQVFEEIGFWLGIGVNNIINIFNPELVIIGGGVAEAGELILAPVRAVVAERTLHPNQDVAEIVLAELGNSAGMLGAAALVFEETLAP